MVLPFFEECHLRAFYFTLSRTEGWPGTAANSRTTDLSFTPLREYSAAFYRRKSFNARVSVPRKRFFWLDIP